MGAVAIHYDWPGVARPHPESCRRRLGPRTPHRPHGLARRVGLTFAGMSVGHSGGGRRKTTGLPCYAPFCRALFRAVFTGTPLARRGQRVARTGHFAPEDCERLASAFGVALAFAFGVALAIAIVRRESPAGCRRVVATAFGAGLALGRGLRGRLGVCGMLTRFLRCGRRKRR